MDGRRRGTTNLAMKLEFSVAFFESFLAFLVSCFSAWFMFARALFSKSLTSLCFLSSLLSATTTCTSTTSVLYSTTTAMSSSAAAPKLTVHEVPCWKDNYAYLLVNEATKDCAAVDPVEADKVKAKADELGLTIRAILTTHHHADHAGGNEDLRRLLQNDQPGLPIYGGDDRILALTNPVGQGDIIHLGRDEQRLDIQVLSTPCHTRGHVLYSAHGAEDSPVLFTGDTLFVAGCGRFFEGDGDQMHNALNKIIAGLPLTTRIFCGHGMF